MKVPKRGVGAQCVTSWRAGINETERNVGAGAEATAEGAVRGCKWRGTRKIFAQINPLH